METGFFSNMAEMDFVGNLLMTIAKSDSGLVVSVLLQNDGCTDKAKQGIPPLIFRGSPQELDTAFFENLKKPVQMASKLMIDMDSYAKTLEQVRKNSAMEKDKAKKEKTPQSGNESKDTKFLNVMKQVDELDSQGKPKDAWMLLDKLTGFPEHIEAIRKRKTELTQRFAPELFGSSTEPQTSTADEVEFEFHTRQEEEEEEDFGADEDE